MNTAQELSAVLEHPAAEPEIAARHFAARLAVETDPYDVHHDLEAGIQGFLIVDPRHRSGYEEGHLPRALHLPHREIDDRSVSGLSRGDLIVVYGWGPGCNAGTKAGLKFANLGFRVKEMIGGFEYWAREGYPIERG